MVLRRIGGFEKLFPPLDTHIRVIEAGLAVLPDFGAHLHDAKDGMPMVLRFATKTFTGEWSDELVDFLMDD